MPVPRCWQAGSKSFPRYRDSWMTYTHYRTNGELVDDWVFLDAHGAVRCRDSTHGPLPGLDLTTSGS